MNYGFNKGRKAKTQDTLATKIIFLILGLMGLAGLIFVATLVFGFIYIVGQAII